MNGFKDFLIEETLRKEKKLLTEDIKNIVSALNKMINDFENDTLESKMPNKTYNGLLKNDLALLIAYIEYYVSKHDEKDKASVGINTFLKEDDKILDAVKKSIDNLQSAKLRVKSTQRAMETLIKSLERNAPIKTKQDDILLLKHKVSEIKRYFRNSSLHVVFPN